MSLANVPFYGAYTQRKEQLEQEPMRELKMASGAIGLQQALQEQAQKQQEVARANEYRAAVSGLGPNPTQEQLLGVASKYVGPDKLMGILQTSLDKKDALQARAAEAQARLDQRSQYETMMHEFRMGRAQTDAERVAETARHNQAMEALAAQNAQFNAHLKGLGIELQRERLKQTRNQVIDRQVQGLGTALERANLPEADAVLRGVEDALNKNPQLAEYLSGPKSLLPDLVVGKDIAAGRQAFQKLFNITLKTRSGAAVTNQELDRLKNEFATGAMKTPEQLRKGVEQARNIISQHYRSVAAGFGPEALSGYNENLRQTGGTPILEPSTPAPASGAPKRLKFDAQGNLVQ